MGKKILLKLKRSSRQRTTRMVAREKRKRKNLPERKKERKIKERRERKRRRRMRVGRCNNLSFCLLLARHKKPMKPFGKGDWKLGILPRNMTPNSSKKTSEKKWRVKSEFKLTRL